MVTNLSEPVWWLWWLWWLWFGHDLSSDVFIRATARMQQITKAKSLWK